MLQNDNVHSQKGTGKKMASVFYFEMMRFIRKVVHIEIAEHFLLQKDAIYSQKVLGTIAERFLLQNNETQNGTGKKWRSFSA